MGFVKSLIGYFFGLAQGYYYSNRYNDYKKKYKITTDFGFNGTDIRFYGEGELEIGNNSYIGSYSTIQIYKGCKVRIGNNCQLSHNVRMYTQSDIGDQDFNLSERKIKTGDVVVGDGVWIGANVFIGPNVRIGKNSIIGANSVVTSDIAPDSIYGGVPAKLIKKKSIA